MISIQFLCIRELQILHVISQDEMNEVMQKIRVLRPKRDQELKINSLIFRQKKTQKMTYEWAQKRVKK